jgi:hypothetical protein
MEYIDYSAGGYQNGMEDMAQQQHDPHHMQAQAQAQQYDHSSSSAIQDGTGSTFYGQNLPQPAPLDAKPRLNKEQHDYLENHYQKQNKPNTNTKKGFAEFLGVSLDKVNVSGRNASRQNRKADRMRRTGSRIDAPKPSRMRRRLKEYITSPTHINPRTSAPTQRHRHSSHRVSMLP